MNTLDSPLEALAFNYVSFGFFTIVHNLWTWVAVATAAFSFWRLRAASSPPPYNISPSSSNGSPAVSELPPPPTTDKVAEPPVSVSCSGHAPVQTPTRSFYGSKEGVTKGKFTFYYVDEAEEEGDVAGAAEEEIGCGGGGGDGGGEWWESWEKVLEMKKGEMWWYRYQDLTELNGHVVRLWDGGRRQGRYNNSETCIVW